MEDISLQDYQVEECGLSSIEAARRLRITIKDEVAKYQHESKSWPIISSFSGTFLNNRSLPVDWFWAAMLISVTVLLALGYILNGDKYRGSAPLFECIITGLFTVTCLALCLRENSLLHSEIKRSILNVLGKEQNSMHHDAFLDVRCPSSPAITVVWTYRDNQLVNLPWNLLVEGDCIVLGPSELAPANIEQVGATTGILHHLDAGEVFNPPHSSTKDGIEDSDQAAAYFPCPKQKFIVLDAPIKRCIRSLLQHGFQRPLSIVSHDMKKIMTALRKKLIWFFLISSIFVNYVRLRLEATTVGHYSEIMLLGTGYVLIPLSPFLFPILWFGVSLYGAARINTIFKHTAKSESSSLFAIVKEFWRILRGDPSSLPRTANLLHTLGSVSVFCCVDKHGVLSYPNLTPGNVLLFKDVVTNDTKEQMPEKDETSEFHLANDIRRPSKCPDNIDEVNFESDQTEVLNISYDFQRNNRIQFDDLKWHDYIESLKPLGLNIMLNSSCCFPLKRLLHEHLTSHVSLAANSTPVPFTRRCMCPLAKEIGFENKVTEGFIKYQQIFSFRPVHASELSSIYSSYFLSIAKEKPVPSMISEIVKDKASGLLQLLSQGSADIVLDACSDFWNGDDLCELSPYHRRKALDFYQRMRTTGHCIAFSYRPLIDESIVKTDDTFIEYPSEAKFSTLESENGSSLSLSRLLIKEQMDLKGLDDARDLDAEDLLQCLNSTQDFSDTDKASRLLNKQIFIGIVTLHDLVKEDITCLVENLNKGGIRFVYFSYENELRSRVFAERLGLETGWNCHISLGSCSTGRHEGKLSKAPSTDSETDLLLHDSKLNNAEETTDTDDEKLHKDGEKQFESNEGITARSVHDDFYFIPNRSKLPRGIRNIRPHLKHVDDVPLLVPLFTDCSPQAISDMIEIMQENGEVVCCFGSSLNIWNCPIFAQADVSISLDPLHPQVCMLNQADNFKNGEPLYSSNFNMNELSSGISSLQLSSILNSLACSYSCPRVNEVDFVSVICEARRLMFNMKSCFLFLMSCYLSLSFLMLISFCLLLPFPLTGLQLLWLTIVIIPILSLSLIATPADSDLMDQMTGKRISNIYQEAKQYFFHFLFTFGLNSLFIVIGLFAWMLFLFCQHSRGKTEQCHFLFGAKSVHEPWHGWSASNREGLFMSQDITLMFITIYFGVLSASHVHRTKHLWIKSPFNNKCWIGAMISCFILQLVQTAVSLSMSNVSGANYNFYPKYVSYPLIFAAFWPLFLLAASETMKRRFIRMNIRSQKRARLKFDTKLGMNSPV